MAGFDAGPVAAGNAECADGMVRFDIGVVAAATAAAVFD